ncbi:MAG: putative ATPase of the MinD/MRP superfamily (mrp-like)(ATP/GTP-binding protein) [Acidobacteria bacterium]|nr:putative ATPase of the MinD/MRP superfamily (mrp-like)(ATP/GTP-binding protein) [Acidobacteriota bacterium]
MATVTQQQVLDALKSVRFPGLSRDIVSFGFIHDLKIDGGNVALTIRFQTENPSVGQQLSRDADVAVRGVEGVTNVDIHVDIIDRQMAPNANAGMGGQKGILEGVTYKIAVASGKGGVGKSTVSTNLALSLRALGFTVGLLDADIYGPSQQMMLGIEGRPQIDETDEKIMPMERHGIKTMSLGLITDPDTPVIWRGPMVMKALDQFLTDVKWGVLDFMIIDLPPGTGDAQLTLTQKVPLTGAVVVTTPQDVALIDARKGLAMFRKVNVPVLGIIENMSYYLCPHCGEREEIFGHGGGRKTAEMLGVPFLGEVPIDAKVVVGGDSGEPIVVSSPDSPAAAAFRELANQIVKQVESGTAGHTHGHDHDHDHDHDHAHTH